ncbi:MAG TPA: MMPL family transporter, partial [Mycobacterium sp.]
MSSFLYRLGRFAAQRRAMVLAAWLVVFALAGVGALFNEGTDDSFEIPGTQSQDALDYLSRVFPETSGSSAQLVIVVPPGQNVGLLASGPSTDAVEAIKKVDQVASVINPFDPNPTGQTGTGERPRILSAVSDDQRAAIITAQLTVPLADVKQDTKSQLTSIGDDLAAAIGHGATVDVGGPAFSNSVPKLSPTEGIGLLIALVVLLLVFRSFVAAGMPLLTAILGVGISVALIYTATL